MNPADLLNEKFPVVGVTFVEGESGLTKAIIATDACTGEVFLQGAHITRFQPTGHEPVLWMSGQSLFEPGKAIRGGVPICFPWFGPLASDPQAPGHGWARTRSWDVASVKTTNSGEVLIVLTMTIESFELAMTITFGSSLTMSLMVTMAIDAKERAPFEEALHTYFCVDDVRKIAIEGLQSSAYIDKVDAATRKPASGEPITFDGECDRVYLETTSTCRLIDPGKKRVIEVVKTNSRNTVVWNPWVDKSARMADFGNDEWPQMVCIETANVGDRSVALMPGDSHTITAEISAVHG